ncbi:hypothetical protein ACIP2X_06855 [Streptomyces sp. NPDC089424]|uniref:hypothetical protein n=1 Tax=Streptomyces sp. NPDC089424 TaxID=3365917 RepID=UPI003809983A
MDEDEAPLDRFHGDRQVHHRQLEPGRPGRRGQRLHGYGDFTASPAPDGRISRLHLTLTSGSDQTRVLITEHLEVWMIQDSAERAKAMQSIYTETVRLMEPDKV